MVSHFDCHPDWSLFLIPRPLTHSILSVATVGSDYLHSSETIRSQTYSGWKGLCREITWGADGIWAPFLRYVYPLLWAIDDFRSLRILGWISWFQYSAGSTVAIAASSLPLLGRLSQIHRLGFDFCDILSCYSTPRCNVQISRACTASAKEGFYLCRYSNSSQLYYFHTSF